MDMAIISRADAMARGLTMYFTGEPCKQGHVAERRVLNRKCRECDKAASRARYEKNKDKAAAYYAKYHPENKERRRERERARHATDAKARCMRTMRNFLQRVISAGGKPRHNRTTAALGYGPEEFRAHIERQFTSGMTWEKVGKEIHIDHIIPLAAMIARGETDPAVINALSNLRPMWAHENKRKGARRVNLV